MNQGYGGDPAGHFRVVDVELAKSLERWQFRDIVAISKMC